jgi:hypothetical protein
MPVTRIDQIRNLFGETVKRISPYSGTVLLHKKRLLEGGLMEIGALVAKRQLLPLELQLFR